MTSGIGTIHLKQERGTLVIQGIGKTPRGRKYILATTPLTAKSPDDPNFKSEMAQAVKEMLSQTLP